jgi:hypothetical protein
VMVSGVHEIVGCIKVVREVETVKSDTYRYKGRGSGSTATDQFRNITR